MLESHKLLKLCHFSTCACFFKRLSLLPVSVWFHFALYCLVLPWLVWSQSDQQWHFSLRPQWVGKLRRCWSQWEEAAQGWDEGNWIKKKKWKQKRLYDQQALRQERKCKTKIEAQTKSKVFDWKTSRKWHLSISFLFKPEGVPTPTQKRYSWEPSQNMPPSHIGFLD